jgi:RNA polymerase sigma factor (sigma-70 family)
LEQHLLNIHEELIERCKAGDQEAHYRLYKLYSKAMFNVCYRILGKQADAEDALQEGFISAFKNISYYRGDATFGAWLKRIVVNKSITILKKRKHELFPDDEQWDVAEQEEQTEYREGLSVPQVRNAIEQLPDGYRTVLTLYLLEGYDHQEIAQITGVSESTSKSQLSRAKNKLKELLTVKS